MIQPSAQASIDQKIADQLAQRRKSPFNNTTIGFKTQNEVRGASIVPAQRVTSQSPVRYTINNLFVINMSNQARADQAASK